MNFISIIIPTCNREYLLQDLIYCLNSIISEDTENRYEILVIDSSDVLRKRDNQKSINIRFIETEIKSAAIQRNIGLKQINLFTDFVAFLDDDVIIEEKYFKNLITCLVNNEAIGVSGIVINKKRLKSHPNNFLQNSLKKLFFLYSNSQGSLLLSGVNIPVSTSRQGAVKSEWLIGCSLWDYKKIKMLKFEEDFYGQSLGEDVIFSYNASRRGNLYVDTNVFITHLESEIGRQNFRSYVYQWLTYRRRLQTYREKSLMLYVSNVVCTMAKLSQVLSFVFMDREKFKQGILGYVDFAKTKKTNEN